MEIQDFTTTFTVENDPAAVFAAIADVPAWWSGEVEGTAHAAGVSFTYRVPGIHFCRMEVVEHAPPSRIVWKVVDSEISYVPTRDEWTGTRIRFEVEATGSGTRLRFTHQGLKPALECWDGCSRGWTALVEKNLRRRIETGAPQPSPW